MYDIPVTLTTNPKKKPEDESKLGFGKIFTDHMSRDAAGMTHAWCLTARL